MIISNTYCVYIHTEELNKTVSFSIAVITAVHAYIRRLINDVIPPDDYWRHSRSDDITTGVEIIRIYFANGG